MDKKEYQEKLNEIGRLIAVEDYSSAAAVADSIEWKRVRNVQTLLMISEIYEAVNRYQDSKILLLRAYRRSPLGRTVLYRLVECTIALRQFDEAIEYYSEYVQAAPRDNNKYILKYKIYRGRGSSVDEQIDILREYLNQEKDSERWSYELARLYHEAGRMQECVNTCDDLVLWYQSGKYVIKALELKKKIAPLTPRQQEIYDRRFEEQDQDEYEDETEASYLKQARAEQTSLQQQETIKSELAEDISRAAKKKQEEAAAPAPQAEAAAPAPQASAASKLPENATAPLAEEHETAPEEASVSAEENATAAKAPEPEGMAAAAETAAEKNPEETASAPEKALPGQDPADAVAEQKPAADPGVSYNEEDLKKNLAESMKKIVAGVGPREEPDEQQMELDRVIDESKEDQESAVASRGLGMTLDMKNREEKKPEAAKLTIDDILLSMGDKGDSVRRAVSAGPAPGNVIPADEEAALNSAASGLMNREAQKNAPNEDLPDAGAKSAPNEDLPDTGAKSAETASAHETEETAGSEGQSPDTEETAGSEDLKPETEKPARSGYEAEDAGAAETDILEAKTRVLPTAQISKLHEEFLRKENLAKDAGSIMAEKIAAQAEAEAQAQAEEKGPEAGPAAPGQDTEVRPMPEDEEDQTKTAPAAENPQDGQGIGEQVMKEVMPRPDVSQPREKVPKTYLKPHQRDLFRGFLGIGTLEEQIANAIAQAESKGGDRTSRSGNVLILGGHGCGKTTIATGIAKAVAEDMGTHCVKMARIYAADLNRKDIAATIAKIAGGVLIIEEAGDLEDSIVDQLTTAMEFRTDGMIMILEDEQRYIHDLLMRHPRFTMKFTAQIYIPAFTPKDLVNFGELYAESQDCTFSEEAKQVIEGRLQAAAKAGEAVSITNVIELTNRAIKSSGRFFRRIQSARRRYDEQNRVILKAKDLR